MVLFYYIFNHKFPHFIHFVSDNRVQVKMVDGAAWKLHNFSTNFLQFATALQAPPRTTIQELVSSLLWCLKLLVQHIICKGRDEDCSIF